MGGNGRHAVFAAAAAGVGHTKEGRGWLSLSGRGDGLGYGGRLAVLAVGGVGCAWAVAAGETGTTV